MSAVLAAVISRAVISPIQKLRDAAHQLGLGKMDTRISIHSKDELGELAGSFNLMADNLTKLMEERGLAQDELSVAHEKLKPLHGRTGIPEPGGRNPQRNGGLATIVFHTRGGFGCNSLFRAEAISRFLWCLVGVQRFAKCPGSNDELGTEFACGAGF